MANSLVESLRPNTAVTPEKIRLREIDLSMRTPGILFLVSALLWLMVGTFFAVLASMLLHWQWLIDFTSDYAWLTFGRVRSAHLNSMAFGWGNNAIFAVALWIMARLCRTEVRHGGLLIIAGCFWNIGVSLGVLGILVYGPTSVEWLEMPPEVAPLLALAYALIGVWAIISFRFRQSGHVYVSQWYILGAIFWFPWLYTIAQMMILWEPARGTVQSITNWWFAHNVLGLWFTPVGVGAIYYILPKVLGKPIHSYYLSILGFWSLALFYNWAGVHHLIGGPIPVWLISAGVVGSVMMVIPVIVVAINHHFTAVGNFKQIWLSPTLRFIVFGGVSYTIVSLFGSFMALRSVNVITHFTHFTVAHAHNGVYTFFTMVMFGAIYFMLPRLLYREWPSARLISMHFWFTAAGGFIYVVGLQTGGWIQGMQMNAVTDNGTVLYLWDEIVANTIPWLMSRSVAGVLLTVGHLAFFANFFWMLFAFKSERKRAENPFTPTEQPSEARP